MLEKIIVADIDLDTSHPSMFISNDHISSSDLASNSELNENYCCYCYIMLQSLLSLQMCYGNDICYCCIIGSDNGLSPSQHKAIT